MKTNLRTLRVIFFNIKGTVSRDFLVLVFGFFHEPVSPQSLIIQLGPFRIFSKIRGDTLVKVHHRYQRHRWQICHRGPTPAAKYPAGINDTGGKLPPISTIPGANFAPSFASVVDTGGKLPPVSTIPAANCHLYQRHRRQICHRCQRHRWQNMEKISGCRLLKENLKAKFYIYVWIIKIFLIKDFFHLPPVSLTPVANLELRISPRIFDKIRNGPNCIIRGLGETDSWKKLEAKNLVTLSL